MEQYVLARIVDMTGIDIGLYDYDRHNAIYFFIVNGDEYVYLRYGGRDPLSGETYLDLDSLEIALELGLERHRAYRAGELPEQPRPEPFFPRDIEMLKRNEMDRGRCVECHLIADYQNLEKERDGTLNPVEDLFRSPNIKDIGIYLDVPKGLVVEKADGAVARAGMQSGDLITALNGEDVLTFGDFIYHYDKLPNSSQEMTLTVDRNDEPVELDVDLPQEWWRVDTYYRFWSVEPQLYFFNEPLTGEEKKRYGFREDGFASRITETDPGAITLRLHSLQEGDIIYAIDGVEHDPRTQDAALYIILTKKAGAELTVSILRDGQKIDQKIRTHREHYRKAPTGD